MSQPDGADAGPLMSKKSGPEPVLTVTGLGVHRGRAEVLRDIDLTVAAGEIVAVLGPNGAGKSTLLNAAAGVLPVRSGHVQRHGRTALVMQAPGLARRSARANVELAMAWWGVPRRQRRRRARQALTLMRAEHLAARPARGLSGGEQRRIHLARAVAVAPDLMLLDEPFDGLDPETHAALREDAVAALRASAGAAVVVLHDRIDAWAMADRIVVLINGRVHADGAPQQVLDHPPSAAVARFLGYDGQLRTGTGMLLTRAAHVRLDPEGTVRGTVTRRIGIEDGLRLEVETGRGSVWALHFAGDVSIGDEVSVAVRTGVEFPSD